MTLSGNLAYDVLVNDPPPQDGLLPNGEPKRFSPQASTLIYGSEEAVLTDPGLTAEQGRAVGDWVEGKGRNLTDIFITHCWPTGSAPASSPPRARSGRCGRAPPRGRCCGTSCTRG
jgi:hypothetical protein